MLPFKIKNTLLSIVIISFPKILKNLMKILASGYQKKKKYQKGEICMKGNLDYYEAVFQGKIVLKSIPVLVTW